MDDYQNNPNQLPVGDPYGQAGVEQTMPQQTMPQQTMPQQPYGQPFGPPRPPQEKAGCLGIGFSFLIPIVGIILYFVNKDKVLNAKNYLIAAAIGFAIGLILQFSFAGLMN